jgi:hypothetical protein
MALSSIDMNTLVYLEQEYKEVKRVNGHALERWNINDNEMIVVEKWFQQRIQEIQKQKEE